MPSRLSSLDSSFLRVETPTAHVHVAWRRIFTYFDRAGFVIYGEPEARDRHLGAIWRRPACAR